MPERLFLFIQFEFPWPLGPPDGRYVLRSDASGEPEQVVVLATLSSRGVPSSRPSSSRGDLISRVTARRRRPVAPEPEPTRLSSARATIVDPVSLSAERQARAWLADLDPGRDVPAALRVLNRVMYAQRIAAADPYVRELSADQAATIRAGWGEGEQVADGLWLHAVELPQRAIREGAGRRSGKGRARSSALRPHERLASLLGAREHPLLCEELALRARLDLDHGRLAHAALELNDAYSAALVELADEREGDLALRVSELSSLRDAVGRAASGTLSDAPEDAPEAQQPGMAPDAHALDQGAQPLDPESLEHFLQRLEAVLRARTVERRRGRG